MLMLSIRVRFEASIFAICTNGFGRWFEPLSTDHANHRSLPAKVAPVIRGSARSSQRPPFRMRERYPFPPIHRATPTELETGALWPSSHENTANVLVSWCAAKKAVFPQFCATRKLWKSIETKGSAEIWPLWIPENGMRMTALPTRLSDEKIFVVT